MWKERIVNPTISKRQSANCQSVSTTRLFRCGLLLLHFGCPAVRSLTGRLQVLVGCSIILRVYLSTKIRPLQMGANLK